VREASGILRGLEEEFLLGTKFAGLAAGDQSVGHATESALNRLLINEQGSLLLRFGQTAALRLQALSDPTGPYMLDR